ncbi:cold-shock protein [Streptomyces roseifaciens]|uniref:cold-shock protein n=1 Tax=Streptomyces roseifaciens TaxID=1488406 RepID=UPI001365D459|nr:cold shock domain-containing protein [Streptomyces roseifaciens]
MRKSIVAAVTALAIAGGGAVTVVATPGTAQAAPASSKIKDKQRRLGEVYWYDAAKGFGYITYRLAGGAYGNLFTHHSLIEKPWKMEQGDIVSFIIAKGPAGYDVATGVKEIADA